VSSPRRVAGRGPTLAALLLGDGLAFVASAQPWWRASGTGAAVTFNGTEVTGGLAQALAAVTLAGVLLALVLRARGRRVLALLLAATGVGMVVTGALQTAPDADTVRSRVRQISLTDQFALEVTPWVWAYAVAGLLVVLGAVLLWLGAPTWTARVARFDRSPTPVGTPADLNADPAQAWKELDAGRDPTADPDERPADPDVRTGNQRVTMDPTTQDHRRE
jgi:uncharacterized membrane protein (TIGR02234 family)